MSEPPQTLEDIIDARREKNLPVQIYISGERNPYPEDVLATARQVAEMIVDDGRVREDDFEDLNAGDVALIEVSAAARETHRDLDDLREVAAVAKSKSIAGVVAYGLGIDLSASALRLLDAKVVVGEESSIERTYRVSVDSFSNDVYLSALDGLVQP